MSKHTLEFKAEEKPLTDWPAKLQSAEDIDLFNDVMKSLEMSDQAAKSEDRYRRM